MVAAYHSAEYRTGARCWLMRRLSEFYWHSPDLPHILCSLICEGFWLVSHPPHCVVQSESAHPVIHSWWRTYSLQRMQMLCRVCCLQELLSERYGLQGIPLFYLIEDQSHVKLLFFHKLHKEFYHLLSSWLHNRIQQSSLSSHTLWRSAKILALR